MEERLGSPTELLLIFSEFQFMYHEQISVDLIDAAFRHLYGISYARFVENGYSLPASMTSEPYATP